jgi:hypothetical protein
MSFKDLEAEIKAWANLEAYAKKAKEDAQEAKRQAKRDKREKKQKQAGLLSPKRLVEVQRLPRHFKRVTIEAREIQHRTWGEVVELTYEVETISDAVAEVAVIEKAREDGYSFDAVVTIVSFEK